jgi:glycosyltransferase involved in cell wall biosynthesis
VFIDRQSHFGSHTINAKIPLFVLLRGHYWSELEWAKKTLYRDPLMRTVIWFRNRIAEKCFQKATAIFPICNWLVNVVKEHHPRQKTHVFLEGINSSRWYSVEGMRLNHPCVGLLQNANWWGKTKEMLILPKVLESLPQVTFYWVGDGGSYTDRILSTLGKYKNFSYIGPLDYPDKVREYLASIDIYVLVSGMDLAPLTLKEAQLMEKPVIATNVGGIPEMMQDNVTGFLVKQGDPDDLIEKISVFLDDKTLAEKMGKSGRKFVIDNFNWEIVAKKFLDSINADLGDIHGLKIS